MKGYVELSQENGTSLCIKCLKAISDYKYEYEEVNKGDPVHLSLTCYSELIKLSEGDRRSNAVFILNY